MKKIKDTKSYSVRLNNRGWHDEYELVLINRTNTDIWLVYDEPEEAEENDIPAVIYLPSGERVNIGWWDGFVEDIRLALEQNRYKPLHTLPSSIMGRVCSVA